MTGTEATPVSAARAEDVWQSDEAAVPMPLVDSPVDEVLTDLAQVLEPTYPSHSQATPSPSRSRPGR